MNTFVCSSCSQQFSSRSHRAPCFRCAPLVGLPDPSPLIQLHESGFTVPQLVSRFHISRDLVFSLIATYSHSRGRGWRPAPVFPPVHLDLDFLDGWLAGDGHLSLYGRSNNAYARHMSAKLGYTSYIKCEFDSMGLQTRPVFVSHCSTDSGYSREGGYARHYVRTRSHPALTEQHARWYPNRSKRFPSDFRLSPSSLLQWYLGDGNLHEGHSPLIAAFIPTLGDVDSLFSRLCGLFGQVACHRQTPHSGQLIHIYFGGPAAQRFFSYIGPCPVPDYAYRWPS